MIQPSLDHIVIAVSDFERSNRFYSEVLGAEVVELKRGRYAYRFGEQQLNVRGPGSELAEPKAKNPAGPGASDLGPLEREGARGTGASVYFRDPDGNLLELIVYS